MTSRQRRRPFHSNSRTHHHISLPRRVPFDAYHPSPCNLSWHCDLQLAWWCYVASSTWQAMHQINCNLSRHCNLQLDDALTRLYNQLYATSSTCQAMNQLNCAIYTVQSTTRRRYNQHSTIQSPLCNLQLDSTQQWSTARRCNQLYNFAATRPMLLWTIQSHPHLQLRAVVTPTDYPPPGCPSIHILQTRGSSTRCVSD